MQQAWTAGILHLPERTYCSPRFSHLLSEGKTILSVIHDRNANLNLLMTGMVRMTFGAAVFLKSPTGCPQVSMIIQRLGCRKRELGEFFFFSPLLD